MKPGPKKGTPRNGGRKKGVPNKIPRAIKDKVMFIVGDLESKGIGLDAQAEEDPKWFFEHFLKPMLPKDIRVDSDSTITIEIVRFSDADETTGK